METEGEAGKAERFDEMLSTAIAGIKLRSPVILASGVLGTVGSSMRRAAESGAGAVVTKSVGKLPRAGHKNPSVIKIEQGYLNSIGLANPGIDEFKAEIETAKQGNAPVVGSIYGFSITEFVEVAKAMESYGVDALELNLSCPNVGKAGAFYGQNEELAFEVVSEIKKNVKVPVIPKLTIHAGDIVSVAKACERAKCDAITAINTVKAMKIDTKVKLPVLGNKIGGLSGPCIKPIALAAVYEIAQEVKVPIIGCGGISTGEDAVEFLIAGASAVEIGVAIADRGLGVFRKVSEEIAAFLKANSCKNVKEIIGIAKSGGRQRGAEW